MPEYPSVLAAVENGITIPSWIAEMTGLHVSTVRKHLITHEAEGRLTRMPGNGTIECPDLWHAWPDPVSAVDR